MKTVANKASQRGRQTAVRFVCPSGGVGGGDYRTKTKKENTKLS